VMSGKWRGVICDLGESRERATEVYALRVCSRRWTIEGTYRVDACHLHRLCDAELTIGKTFSEQQTPQTRWCLVPK
jgi:hypothetical protein